ncbi:hypothetical protein KIN20_034992 [Parelaphostrongylus tenuis]|uniref:Uncharacterized protein n=1 Tax=Parelaphostrongylus tenuis TaxID=148309 RepID=A0AAD5RAH8_PARTN|nr:hypothetical protein KIN20_034992 [Parelaphostrongylus tenuis]
MVMGLRVKRFIFNEHGIESERTLVDDICSPHPADALKLYWDTKMSNKLFSLHNFYL